MKKRTDACFLCDGDGKLKKVTFYSGVMKGGTTHHLASVTVTFFERWSDLTMHEIQVCRDCQVRLWRQKHFLPMLLCGIGAAVLALVGVVALILVPGPARFAALGLALVATLAAGAVGVVLAQRYFNKKPKHAQTEPLVVAAAKTRLPNEGLTFLTSEQYVARYEQGVFG
jgi:hypothetical protein